MFETGKNWRRHLLWGVTALLAFSFPPAVTAEDDPLALEGSGPPVVPTEGTPELATDPTPAPSTENQFCPFNKSIEKMCSQEPRDAESLFGDESGVNPWHENYTRVDRCKLWWWADQAQTYRYAPLTEWASYVKDALLEDVERSVIFETVGLAPLPPPAKLNESKRPSSNCKVPTGQQWLFLSEKLRRLNLLQLTPELLNELVQHCLAFPVEASVWKTISTAVISSYVIPLGDLNFVVLAQTHFTLNGPPKMNRPENFVAASKEFGVSFTTVGACPVKKDPRNCVEEFIRETKGPAQFAYPNGFTHAMSALPGRADIDSLYSGGGITGALDIELEITPDGNVHFFHERKDGHKKRVNLAIDEDGLLALETDDRLCDPESDQGKPLTLRLIAYGERANGLFKELAAYGPHDFPESKRLAASGVEKGCKSGRSYSEWVAETANAAKHYAYHGMPWDTLYRSTAYQRYKWSLKSKGIPQIRDNLVFGMWRKDAQESPLKYGSKFETQATDFAQIGGDGKRSPASITYRTIVIDDLPATEVWYYSKPLSYWPGQQAQGHVVINHLKNFNEIYSRSVIAKLTQLSTTCGTLKDHKRGFLAAMYALFNAAPLQKGSEAVGKAFMAGAYHYLFGYKIRAMKELVDIDVDAQTMSLDNFIKYYLPLI